MSDLSDRTENQLAGSSARTNRVAGYDAFRGLAVLAMVVDHLAYVLEGPAELRSSIGRLAMPMFFLLAGHLSRRLSWRHLGIFGVGSLLPVLVPWIDNPNVLVWWAIGCLLLAIARAASVPVWLIAAVGLALAANGRVDVTGINGAATYDAAALWGLMALGTLLPSSAFTWAARAPRWIVAVGSYPLTFYVGHLLVLQAALLLL